MHYFGEEPDYELRDDAEIKKGESMALGVRYSDAYEQICAKNKLAAKNKVLPKIIFKY